MTAEITVMNASGVALAADSAVTIGNGSKIYNSANKLFSISKYHPVGIMIYGNADFLGIPWETLIKVYRENLGEDSFDKLNDYCSDFIKFLENNLYNEISSFEIEKKSIMSTIELHIQNLFNELLKVVQDAVNKIDKQVSNEERELILKSETSVVLDNILSVLNEKEYIKVFNEDDVLELLSKYEYHIDNMIHVHFEDFILSEDWEVKIKDITAQSILKSFTQLSTGIVFAGFGENELYPSVHSIEVEGKVNRKIKYHTTKSRSINHESRASIIPFAQSDMVHAFITGIDQDIQEVSDSFVEQVLTSLPNELFSQIQGSLKEDADIEQLQENFKMISHDLFKSYNSGIESFKKEQFTDPMLRIVRSLPKEELADIAEALVNLTSFKKKVSSNLESVGGPTDVAVITKGDGFVWIKRKHYFNYEKNRHFFEKYYWRDKNEQDNSGEGFSE